FMLTVSLLGFGSAFPSGAIEDSCNNLLPGHGVSFQPSNPGYTIEVREISQGVYNVKLSGPAFKGYIMQAFKDDGTTATGKFTTTGTNDKVICHGTGVTHTSATPKEQVNVQWQGTQVSFKATVVQNYSTVFGNIVSGQFIA
ncbi:hypothetical protein SK128_024906, partial [Halocaridina rubra]